MCVVETEGGVLGRRVLVWVGKGDEGLHTFCVINIYITNIQTISTRRKKRGERKHTAFPIALSTSPSTPLAHPTSPSQNPPPITLIPTSPNAVHALHSSSGVRLLKERHLRRARRERWRERGWFLWVGGWRRREGRERRRVCGGRGRRAGEAEGGGGLTGDGDWGGVERGELVGGVTGLVRRTRF